MNKIISTERKYKLQSRSHRLKNKYSGGTTTRAETGERKVNQGQDNGIHPIIAGEKMKKSEDGLKNLRDNIKQANIYITGVPEGADTENLLGGGKKG